MLCAYLAIDLRVNSGNYLVSGGLYGLGPHVVTNARDYLVALYVGKGNALNYSMIAVGLAVMLFTGSRRVRFAPGWMMLALLPFVFFAWGPSTRYVYLAAVGFSMLLAEGVTQVDRRLRVGAPKATRVAVVTVVAAALAVRFAVFAAANVKSFARRTEEYRRYGELFTQEHGTLPPYSRVGAGPDAPRHPARFLKALIQWEYRDPTLELIVDASEPR